MQTTCRPWWRNCAAEVDPEILAIDQMEDRIAPLNPNASRIRELISSLELCHHKAERWISNIIEAIAAGETTKGLGTRPSGRSHPAEEVWQSACAALSAWCAGCPAASVNLSVGAVPAKRLLAGLGERSPLKEWQVQRVIEKTRSLIHWPQPANDLAAQYVWLLLSDDVLEYDDGASMYRDKCPEHYKEHEDFWLATVRTILQDTDAGKEAELPLGLAIDMLWPCHWDFVENLRLVLEAIGGKLSLEKPFAACGRNIALMANQNRMEIISNTLKDYCRVSKTGQEVDGEWMKLLGKPTDEKRWLAVSLDKTIRLQLNPQAKMRTACALAGPEWIRT